MMNQEARPKPVAATVGLAFGGLWFLIGGMSLPLHLRSPAEVVGLAITLALIVRLWLRHRPSTAQGALFRRKGYIAAVVLEVAAIYTVSALLPRWRMQGYFISVVGVLVGAHFIGLWQATKQPKFLWISASMCAVSGLSAFAPESVMDLDLRNAIAGFGNALVLWLFAQS